MGYSNKPLLGSLLKPDHPLSKGLVACYVMNEGSGDRVSCYAMGIKGTFPTSESPIWDGGGIKFASSNGIRLGPNGAQSPPPLNFGNNKPISIFAVVKGGGATTNWLYGDAVNEIVLRTGSTTTIEFILNSFTTNDRVSSPAGNMAGIYSMAGTYNGVILSAYLNGVGASVTPTGTYAAPGAVSCIGGNSPEGKTQSFNGTIYIVYVYNVGLTPSEITQLHADPYCMFYSMEELVMMIAAGQVVAGGLSIPRPLSRPFSGPFGGI